MPYVVLRGRVVQVCTLTTQHGWAKPYQNTISLMQSADYRANVSAETPFSIQREAAHLSPLTPGLHASPSHGVSEHTHPFVVSGAVVELGDNLLALLLATGQLESLRNGLESCPIVV